MTLAKEKEIRTKKAIAVRVAAFATILELHEKAKLLSLQERRKIKRAIVKSYN